MQPRTLILAAVAILAFPVLAGTLGLTQTILFYSVAFGMAVTADQLIEEGDRDRSSAPVAASITLYAGTFAFIDTNGRLTNVTNSGANDFAGVVPVKADNSAGAAGAIPSDVKIRGQFKVPFSGGGLTQADIGKRVYAVDNHDASLTSTNNSYMGTLRAVIDANNGMVDLDPHVKSIT